MTVVTAALSVSAWDEVATAGAELADRARRYEWLDSRPLLEHDGLASHALVPAAARSRITISRPDAQTVIVGTPASCHAAGPAIAAQLAAPGTTRAALPHGRWLALRHDRPRSSLRVLGDPLGTAWLYFARQPNGYLLSSDLAALVSLHRGPLTVDYDSLLMHLAIGYDPGQRTLFREVELLAPGAVVELGPDGATVLSQQRPAYGDAYAGVPDAEKADRLSALLLDGLRDWCDGDFDDVIVSLSGGHDSPHALAGLLALGVRPSSATWGHERSENARVARLLTTSLGLPWHLVERPRSSWEGWLGWFRNVGSAGFDWAGWADDWLAALAGLGSGALIGFLGDALSGKHLDDRGRPGDSWIDHWLAWSADRRWLESPLLTDGARARITDLARARLMEQSAGIDFAFPHQRALHLDVYGRQRRMIAAQPNMAARFLAPLTFFYTAPMVDFWSNLDWPAQRQQALYLGHARARYGSVFQPLLTELERRRHGRPLARTTRRARLALANVLPGQRQRIAPSGNDLMGNLLRFKPQLRDLLGTTAELLEPVLDTRLLQRELERYPQSRLLTPFRLHTLLNLGAQLELAVERPAA